jgi:hypothetical protein
LQDAHLIGVQSVDERFKQLPDSRIGTLLWVKNYARFMGHLNMAMAVCCVGLFSATLT